MLAVAPSEISAILPILDHARQSDSVDAAVVHLDGGAVDADYKHMIYTLHRVCNSVCFANLHRDKYFAESYEGVTIISYGNGLELLEKIETFVLSSQR